MTPVSPISHKKNVERAVDKINPPIHRQILNKIEDFNNIVVMSGTAKRKPLEKKENHSEIKVFHQNNFKDSILKLRAPFYKSHHKQAHAEEKLMTKSCEILLGCIKPYKDIRVAKTTKVTESIRVGNILKTTNVIYERKATRKVQIFGFSRRNPTSSLFSNTENPSLNFSPGINSLDFDSENLEIKDEEKYKVFDETCLNQTGRTTSSEDFITKVFQEEAPRFI